jgi:hypothetical protein
MAVDPISIEVDGSVCDKLISLIGRPEGFRMCRASNVFGNRYRINVYVKDYKGDLETQRIGYSCFARLDGKELNIIHETPKFSGLNL